MSLVSHKTTEQSWVSDQFSCILGISFCDILSHFVPVLNFVWSLRLKICFAIMKTRLNKFLKLIFSSLHVLRHLFRTYSPSFVFTYLPSYPTFLSLDLSSDSSYSLLRCLNLLFSLISYSVVYWKTYSNNGPFRNVSLLRAFTDLSSDLRRFRMKLFPYILCSLGKFLSQLHLIQFYN